MPVRYALGADALIAPSGQYLAGASSAGLSCWIRVNAASASINTVYGFYFAFAQVFYLQRPNGQTNKVNIGWVGANGNISVTQQTLTIGIDYQLTMSWTGGAQAIYLNAAPIRTGTVAGGMVTNASGTLQIGNNHPGLNDWDFTLDDFALWNGYAPTQADALALRDRVKTPAQVNAASLIFGLTLDGVAGVKPVVGDAGVVNYGTLGSGFNVSSVPGAPAYDGTPLVYVPPTVIRLGEVLPSGTQAAFVFQSNPAGTLTNVTAANIAPTVQINGGAPQALTNLVWGSAGTAQPWLLGTLPQAVTASDVVTYATAEGWVTTTAGGISAASGTLTNQVGGSALPAFTPGGKSMRAGYNVEPPLYYNALSLYANLARQAGNWLVNFGGTPTLNSLGYFSSLNGADVSTILSLANTNGGCPNAPPGVYTLLWDGDGVYDLRDGSGGSAPVTLLTSTLTGTVDNRRTYQVSRVAGQFYLFLNLHTNTLGTTATATTNPNIRIYGPGVATDGSQKWHPRFLAQLRESGAQVLRFMDALFTNVSTVASYADWTPPAQFSYSVRPSYAAAGVGHGLNDFTLTNIAPSSLVCSSGRTPLLLTSSAPHGLSVGHLVTFKADCGNFTTADLVSRSVKNALLYVVRVPSSTTFEVAFFTSSGSAVNGSQAYSGTAGASGSAGLPLADLCDLCNTVGADCWLNIPPGVAANPAAATATFAQIAASLSAARKCYVEFSNETWNSAFAVWDYAYCQAQLDGTLPGSLFTRQHQWIVKQAAALHTLAAAAFVAAGRPATDVVRVLGTQLAGASGFTADLLAYGASQGYPFDRLAVAPYFEDADNSSAWQTAYATLLNTWTVDQLHDLTQLWIQYGLIPTWLAQQVAQIQAQVAAYPNLKLAAYEGGPQCGAAGGSNAVTLSHQWARHPRVADAYLYVLDMHQNPGAFIEGVTAGSPGCLEWCHFNIGQFLGQAHVSGDAMWGAFPAWSTVIGKGDGSDGRFNNVGHYEELGGLVVDDGVVSVIGYALALWNGYPGFLSGLRVVLDRPRFP